MKNLNALSLLDDAKKIVLQAALVTPTCLFHLSSAVSRYRGNNIIAINTFIVITGRQNIIQIALWVSAR